MKRLIVAGVMALALVLPAGADQQFMVWVNHMPLQENALMVNDRIYVPLRAVGERLNCDISWDGQNAQVNSAVKRPPITGNTHFQDVVTKAMDLLQEKDPADYVLMCQIVDEVWINKPDKDNPKGFMITAQRFANSIAFNPDFIKGNKFIPERVAGVLVHETSHIATHRIQTHAYNAEERKQDEKISYEHELTALKLIGASQSAVNDAQIAMSMATK